MGYLYNLVHLKVLAFHLGTVANAGMLVTYVESMVYLLARWMQNKVAVLCNVGTLVEPVTRAEYEARSKRLPDQLFSHQDQQDQWQTSKSDGPIVTGWGGRIADRVLALNGSVAFPMIISTRSYLTR